MPGLKVVKVTPGRIVNGRFVPAKANPKKKCKRKNSAGTRAKKKRFQEMLAEWTKKKNAKRRKRAR